MSPAGHRGRAHESSELIENEIGVYARPIVAFEATPSSRSWAMWRVIKEASFSLHA